ncbi:histidine phosphatase family protein [Actinomycetota bacterium Odt1-20B]
MRTTLLLLRHGETALTAHQRLSGSGGDDPPLSGTGRGQADAAAELLAARGGVQAVVSSPLRRCRETAGAAARRLGLAVRVDEGLREADFGAWEGLTFAEVRERYPREFAAWQADPAAVPGGTGESFASVTNRVEQARDKLLAEYAGQVVLVVSHVAPLRTLVRLALGAPPRTLFRMDLAAASLSKVTYDGAGEATLRCLNDTSHL